MEATELEVMKKKEFERLLYVLNGGKQISVAAHYSGGYDGEAPVKLSLYYNTDGVHMGTWQRGSNCVFLDSCANTVSHKPYILKEG